MRRALAALLVGAALVGTAAPAAALGRPERKLVRFVNEARHRHGLRPLDVGWRITTYAQLHTRNMAESRQLFHGGYGWPWRRCWGQNVAVGSTSVWGLHRALMRSPGHRANILSRCFTRVGLDVRKSGDRLWVVEDFAG